mgnify:CR=1 FL=1
MAQRTGRELAGTWGETVEPVALGRATVVALSVLLAVVTLAVAAGGAATGAPAADATTPADGAAAPNATPVDVVFVFDSSVSTNENRYHMAQEIEDLRAELAAEGVDARYGLLTFNESVRVEQPLTDDFAAFERAMHFPTAGNEEHASRAVLAATEMAFREDARRVIVLVTDEDDDSDAATRRAARERLANSSNTRFVAVSPADAYESSCAVHSPPCDDDGDNELRTVAEDVDGDWIDVGQDAAAVVEAVGETVAPQVNDSADDGTETADDGADDGADVDLGADYVTRNLSVNRTTAEVGDAVRVTKTVTNVGSEAGRYRAYLSHEGEILQHRTTWVHVGQTRTITFVYRFDEPGEYEPLVTHEPAGTVEVTPPREPTVETTVHIDGEGVSASVADATAGGEVTVPLGDAAMLDAEAGGLEAVTLSLGDVDVTPVHDVVFDAAVVARETPPDGLPGLPPSVSNVTYLTVDSTLGEHLTGVTVEHAPASETATLYRHDEGVGWVPVDGDARRLPTDADGNATFAVGVRRPALEVVGVDLASDDAVAGDPVAVRATVANDGTAAGTYRATLAVDGETVAAENVTVPAGERREVVLTYTPETPGEHTLSVGADASVALSVERPPTPTATATTATATTTAPDPTTATGSPTAASATTPTAAETTDRSPGTAGVSGMVFVAALPLLAGALLVGALLRRR